MKTQKYVLYMSGTEPVRGAKLGLLGDGNKPNKGSKPGVTRDRNRALLAIETSPWEENETRPVRKAETCCYETRNQTLFIGETAA